MKYRIFNMLMDQVPPEGVPAGEVNPPAGGAGADKEPVGQKPGTPEKGAGEVQVEITVNGKKETISQSELIARAQRNSNITEKEQEVSNQRKSLDKKLRQADMIIADLKAKEESGQDLTPTEENLLEKTNARVQELEAEREQRNVDKAFEPIRTKFPEVNEYLLFKNFRDKVLAGEVDDTPKGMMEVAEGMSKDYSGKVTQSLETTLKDNNNPITKKHNAEVIKDYLKNKKKYAYVFGEGPGGGGAGVGDKPISSISEAAERSLQ